MKPASAGSSASPAASMRRRGQPRRWRARARRSPAAPASARWAGDHQACRGARGSTVFRAPGVQALAASTAQAGLLERAGRVVQPAWITSLLRADAGAEVVSAPDDHHLEAGAGEAVCAGERPRRGADHDAIGTTMPGTAGRVCERRPEGLRRGRCRSRRRAKGETLPGRSCWRFDARKWPGAFGYQGKRRAPYLVRCGRGAVVAVHRWADYRNLFNGGVIDEVPDPVCLGTVFVP